MAAGLLGAALAGCGTQVATATLAQAPSSPPAVGCAAVSQATAVTVRRSIHLVEPVNTGPLNRTQRNPALVRALFTDFCQAVAHPYKLVGILHCPADFGIDYTGTFYAGTRPLAMFGYSASGCPDASLTVAGKTRATLMLGSAAAAAPHLAADLAAVLGESQTDIGTPTQQINPGGPDKPATS